MILFAIDPGVDNGLAIYDTQSKVWIYSGEVPVWNLFARIEVFTTEFEDRIDCKIFIEDPRMVKFNLPEGRAQGAGWVKTLAGQYQRYCIEKGIKYELIRPSHDYTKKDVDFVKRQTGITTLKKNHNERDAIMLLYYYGLH